MYKYTKRLIDIIISIGLLLIGFIPMILIAIAIKLESDGPAIFKQTRTGKDGKEFMLYKFRSMVQDNNVLDKKTEDRTTRVGEFIRRTSLDELPQIVNILKGDMSFIGPRPWIVEYYANFTDYQKKRVNVRPGVTGLAQAMGRNNLSIFDKINYDIDYVDNYSFMMDMKVIFLTIKSVILKTGVEHSKSYIHEEINELRENYLYVTKPLPFVDKRIYEKNQKSITI